MNVSVGLLEGRSAVEVELTGTFTDTRGKSYNAGRHKLISEVTLTPSDSASCAFALDDITIGIGFHWERKERQVFRGALRLVKRTTGLTVINDVPLEDYVTSVISSEMSASCPLEMLKAHAVISRSWLWFPKANPPRSVKSQSESPDSHEILRWYGREAHPDFDVCADDHCQRYQGITKAFSPAAAEAVRATAGEFLRYNGAICDARFSKCCGGITERYATAWERPGDSLSRVYLRRSGAIPLLHSKDMDRFRTTGLLQYARFGTPRTRSPRVRSGNSRLLSMGGRVHPGRTGCSDQIKARRGPWSYLRHESARTRTFRPNISPEDHRRARLHHHRQRTGNSPCVIAHASLQLCIRRKQEIRSLRPKGSRLGTRRRPMSAGRGSHGK